MHTSEVMQILQGRKPGILNSDKLKKAAVLLPLVEKDNETHILFEVRSIEMRSQPGDVCFPGGRIDKDDRDEQHSAIRETSEELGINEATIEDIIPLDYMVSDFGRIIYPFIGKLTPAEEIVPNRAEVEEVFTVPLSYFLQTEPERYKVNFQVTPEADFPYDLIYGGENYDWRTRPMEELFFQYD